MKKSVIPPGSTRGSTAPQKRATPQSGPATLPAPAHDDIAQRAFDIYDKNGRQEGQCQQNWQQAEQELQHEGQAT